MAPTRMRRPAFVTLAALEDAIEEAGNTRRGRALKRQAEKIRSAIRSRGGKAFVAALEAEAKEAAERASCSSTPFPDFHWQNQCSQAADTLRELIARRERKA